MFELRSTTVFLVCLMPTTMLRSSDPSNPPGTQLHHAADIASAYVPIESWVYRPFDRLIAEGYVPSAPVSLRPWTRLSCARLVKEAARCIADDMGAPFDAATLRPEWRLRLENQAERWHFPLLSAAPQHDDAITIQLSYRPLARPQK